MDLGYQALLLATLAMTFGAMLQAATGLGAGMVAFPLIALISLKLVPGPLIFSTFFLSFYMAYIGRSNIRFTSMNALVFLTIRRLTKSFRAEFTLKRAITSVNALMSLQSR